MRLCLSDGNGPAERPLPNQHFTRRLRRKRGGRRELVLHRHVLGVGESELWGPRPRFQLLLEHL